MMIKKILVISLALTFILSPTTAQSPFTDVSTNHWAYSYIEEVTSKGIVSGYEDNTFRPNETVTRGQLAKFLSNTMKYMGHNEKEVNINYTDNEQYSERTIDIVAHSLPSIVQVTSETGSIGTGFVIKDNQILTAYHVVRDKKSIEVTLTTGKKYSAKVVKSDTNSDLALLRIDETPPLPYLEFENEAILGESLLVIGNNNGEINTVTRGIVSNLSRKGLIQTDAAVNSGSSGSPVFNMEGKVIGIVIAKMDKSGIDNVAYAVRSSNILYFLNN